MDKIKKHYEMPELTIHGDLREITKKGYGPNDDQNTGSKNPPIDPSNP